MLMYPYLMYLLKINCGTSIRFCIIAKYAVGQQCYIVKPGVLCSVIANGVFSLGSHFNCEWCPWTS